MDNIYSYFCVQLKRVLKILPIQLLVNLTVFILVGGLAFFLIYSEDMASGKIRYKIGVVGDMNDSYLGFGIMTLQAIDDSRFILELVNVSEEEAREGFQRGELYSFVRIPDGLIQSIDKGKNDRLITYVTTEGQRGIGSIVMGEIVDIVSEMVTNTQSAIYGMQKLLVAYDMKDALRETTDKLSMRYFDVILSREEFCDVEIIGISNGLSMEGYYFCSILIFFLLLLGISSSLLFSHRSDELPRFLKARGIGAPSQIIGEYLAYLGMLLACIIEIFLILAVIFAGGFFNITEWERAGASPLGGFLLRFLPVILMMSAMQFLLYELVQNIVSNLLLQFLCGVSMGYLSGFFYPANFFPDTLQKIGHLLPTGVALTYTDGSLAGNFSWTAFIGILFYFLCFWGLSVIARRNRIHRG